MMKLAIVLATVLFSASAVMAEDAAPNAAAPKEAVVLFSGKDLSKWEYKKDKSDAKWKLVEDDAMEVAGGDIITRDKFGDYMLHVEFRTPNMPDAKGQARGNSGVYLADSYEIQVLDSYGLQSKKDDCGSIYNQKAPDVNACKPPEQWQTYDITFHAARFDADGKKTQNPRVTVIQNGQKIQNDVEITGVTRLGDPESPGPGAIRLQDHGNKVRYRNVWLVPMTSDSKDAK